MELERLRNSSLDSGEESSDCRSIETSLHNDGKETRSERRRRQRRGVGPRERVWPTVVSSLIASILTLLSGMTFVFPNSVLPKLTAVSTLEIYKFDTQTLTSEMFGALTYIGALTSGPVAGWVADYLGRKPALLLSGLPYLGGYLMIAFAQFSSTVEVFRGLMLTGQLLAGFGVGWSCLALPVYLSEISSARLRGMFGNIAHLYLVLGSLAQYILEAIPGFQYYNIALVIVMIVVVFELGMVWLPETPRWLVFNEKKDEGKRVLQWLRGSETSIVEELSDLEASAALKGPNISQVAREFTKRSVLFPFFLVNIIMFLQLIGGLEALGTYITLIFREAGVTHPQLAAVYAVGIPEFISALIAGYIVDIAGRKLLLVVSGIGTFLGTLMLGTHFYITRPSLCSNSNSMSSTLRELAQDSSDSFGSCNMQYAPLAITSMILFFIAFAFGWGPIPWILMTELVPQTVRGVASGVATFVNWATSAIVVGFYLNFAKAVTPWFAWWTFAFINLLGVVFVCVFIPETKRKTLEEIQKNFERGWRWKEKDEAVRKVLGDGGTKDPMCE